MATVTLTHTSINSGSPVRVLCDSVRVQWKNNIIANPKANGGSVVEVQTQGFENPVYRVSRVHFTGASGTLTYAQLLTLAKVQYDGTNPITLAVTYGSGTQLVASDGTSTSIKVVFQDFGFPIDASDSKNGYLPVADFSLMETA